MTIASDIIAKAQARIPQGTLDSEWSSAEWLDYLNDSLDMAHEAIVDAALPYYIVSATSLAKGSGALFPLPDGCYAVLWVQDDQGEQIEFMDHQDRHENEYTGFVLTNNNIELVNWDGNLPATITIDYRKHPTIISVLTEIPEAPLHDDRGARLLAKLMVVLAAAKDEALTVEQKAIADAAISTFVDRLGSMNQTADNIVGA